jgi:hypothetical protein
VCDRVQHFAAFDTSADSCGAQDGARLCMDDIPKVERRRVDASVGFNDTSTVYSYSPPDGEIFPVQNEGRSIRCPLPVSLPVVGSWMMIHAMAPPP